MMGCENEKTAARNHRPAAPPEKGTYAMDDPVSATEIETIPKSKAFQIQSSVRGLAITRHPHVLSGVPVLHIASGHQT